MAYSIESESAIREASMTFSDTPTVLHVDLPSVDLMSTLTLAAVAALSSSTRTL